MAGGPCDRFSNHLDRHVRVARLSIHWCTFFLGGGMPGGPLPGGPLPGGPLPGGPLPGGPLPGGPLPGGPLRGGPFAILDAIDAVLAAPTRGGGGPLVGGPFPVGGPDTLPLVLEYARARSNNRQ